MQKLIWKNSLGNEINLTKAPYGIIEWEGFSNAPLNIQSQQVPFEDGGVFLDALIEQRELSVTLKMQDNNNLETRYRLRRELIHILNPKLGEGYLIYTNDFTTKRIKCTSQIPLFPTHNSNDSGTPKASLSWTACNPYWEDLEETSIVIQGNNFVNIDYQGDYKCEPEIQLLGSGTNPKLKNLSNETKLVLSGEVQDSIINLTPGRKSANKKRMGFSLIADQRKFFLENDELLVSVGRVISVTKDMVNYETVYIPSENLWCGTYGNGLFVIGEGTNKLIKSSDGIHWENISTRPSGFLNCCMFDSENNLFYFIFNYKFYYSSDCETFTEVQNSAITVDCHDMVRKDNYIFIVGNSGKLYYVEFSSGLPYSISEITTQDSENYYAIATDGTSLVYAGENVLRATVNPFSYSYYSTRLNGTVKSIGYHDGKFFCVGDNGFVFTLFDIYQKGNDWVYQEKDYTIGSRNLSFCRYSKLFSRIKIYGENQVDYINDEFILLSDIPDHLLCCVYFKGKYIAGSLSGTIYISEDFQHWTSKSINGISENIELAESTENCAYFFCRNGDYFYTEDGEDFTVVKTYGGEAVRPSHWVYYKGYYYRDDYGSSNHSIYRSQDGSVWELATNLENTEYVRAIIVTNNILFVVKDNDKFLTTDNGVDWSTINFSGSMSNIDTVEYWNGYYICVGQDYAHKTSDFSTYEEILSDYSGKIFAVQLINNNLFFTTLEIQEEPTPTYIFKILQANADVTELTLLKTYENTLAMLSCYYNGEYYINLLEDLTIGGLYTSESTSDFQTFTSHDYMARVENNRFYEIVYNNGHYSLIYNNETIYTTYYDEQPIMCHDLLFVYSNSSYYATLPDVQMIGSPIHDVVSCYLYKNGDKLILLANYIYLINKDEITDLMGGNVFGITGYDDYLITIGKVGTYTWYGPTRTISIYDINDIIENHYEANPIKSYNASMHYTPTEVTKIENLQGICIASEIAIAWFEKSEDFSVERLCSFNFNSELIYKYDTNNSEFTDFICKDSTLYAIGGSGILYTIDGSVWKNELTNTQFTFKYFVRNKDFYFVGLYQSLGNLTYSLGDNIINQVKDINFNLQVGENKIILNLDSGVIVAVLKFRNKYIGV